MNKLLKRGFIGAVAAVIVVLISINRHGGDQTFVILSTNDMHAQIDKYPVLGAAIKECRDTVDVILVDAGDRWTGNAFVDLVEHYAPVYQMMNILKYDVTIYGNHEFDKGQAYVAAANRQATFPTLGANIKSDTTSFPQPPAYAIIECGGKKIAFVGVVGNYDANDHPAGKDESFEGISFIDPHVAAAEYGYLANECDMLVLISHSGLERDVEFAQSDLSAGYDHIVSAHSHDLTIQTVEGKLISQTGSRLQNIGATTVTITRSGEVKLSHKNVELAGYTPDAELLALTEKYHNNPMLIEKIGSAAEPFQSIGVRNLFAETIRARTASQIGIYHSGGVRISQIPQGDINMSLVLNAEPFNSYITTLTMNTAQLKKLIMTKFNDTVNIGESHHIDMIATTPYTVIVDPATGDAVDVIFPELDDEKSYKVATGDYIYKTYRGLSYTNGKITDTLITTALQEVIEAAKDGLVPSNVSLQTVQNVGGEE